MRIPVSIRVQDWEIDAAEYAAREDQFLEDRAVLMNILRQEYRLYLSMAHAMRKAVPAADHAWGSIITLVGDFQRWPDFRETDPSRGSADSLPSSMAGTKSCARLRP